MLQQFDEIVSDASEKEAKPRIALGIEMHPRHGVKLRLHRHLGTQTDETW